MRCRICDFCAETHDVPTDNAVTVDPTDGTPICLACQEEINATIRDFEGDEGTTPLPEPELRFE